MLKIPVLASDITHLTDARYFAAWGVDYLAYSIDEGSELYMSSDAIAAITDWVEGPKVLASTQGLNVVNDLLSEYESLLDGYLLGSFTPSHVLDAFDGKMLFHELVVENHKINSITLSDILAKTEHIILKSESNYSATSELAESMGLNPSSTFIDTMIQSSDLVNPKYGIVIRGAAEEKTGVKSYDDIDDIMDILAE